MGIELRARSLELSYPAPAGAPIPVLDVELFTVAAGESVGIAGPSGAGKTSLLDVLTGLIPPQHGSVSWAGTDITRLGERQRDRWRRATVGFVFQDFHLIPELSMLDNVLLPVSFSRAWVPAPLHRRALELIARMGLERSERRAGTLSRGEMQRVAVARAMLPSPLVVVADEPTANLDSENARLISRLLLECCDAARSTLLVVSHDQWLLDSLDRTLSLEGGRLVSRVAAVDFA